MVSVAPGSLPVDQKEEKLKEVARRFDVQQAGQSVVGLGKVVWRASQESLSLSAKAENERTIQQETRFCVTFSSQLGGGGHLRHTLMMCADRQVKVDSRLMQITVR